MDESMKKGDRIRIIHMDDCNGKDWRVSQMNGLEAVIDYIDDAGQIHLKGYGVAIIPGIDIFEVIWKEHCTHNKTTTLYINLS